MMTEMMIDKNEVGMSYFTKNRYPIRLVVILLTLLTDEKGDTMAHFNRNRHLAVAVLIIMLTFFPALNSYAASVTIPNTFTSGTTISSSQVNENFSTLANAINSMSTNTIPTMAYGLISANGTIFSGSGNFTVSKNTLTAGTYSIAFSNGFPNKTPACVISSGYGVSTSPVRVCGLAGTAPDGIDIVCVQYTISGRAIVSTPSDVSFNFICIF